MTQQDDSPFRGIVAIGASAGGLASLEKFFQQVGDHSDLAYVVIQHLAPDHKSLMDEILSRQTALPVLGAQHEMEVRPNHVYLIPPGKVMRISQGLLMLTDIELGQHVRRPIDDFFCSLAGDAGCKAVAVVLSGSGADGAKGVAEVHQAGGLVLCETPETAAFDSMPRAAQGTNCVHMTLPPEAMPEAIERYLNTGLADDGVSLPGDSPPSAPMEKIFHLLRDNYDLDFSFYKPNTVVRRTQRRLSLNSGQPQSIEEYASRLAADPNELNALYQDLLIGVTQFFRDDEAFQKLSDRVLPSLIESKKPHDELRVWVAGCATGEEAYSLAMLIDEQLRAADKPLDVKIFATDVHRASLNLAGAGVYPLEKAECVSPERRRTYFEEQSDALRVSKDLRRMIVFARHNLLKDAPFTNLDLVCCRNLLIYLQPVAQAKAISRFHFGLTHLGTMVLGPSESPGELSGEFETIDSRWKIYRKRRDVRLPLDMRMPSVQGQPPKRHERSPAQRSEVIGHSHLLPVYEQILDTQMSSVILVDDRRDVVRTFGGAHEYLSFPSGRPSSELLDMVDGDLRLTLADGLQRADATGEPASFEDVEALARDQRRQIDVTVTPIRDEQADAGYFLITLKQRTDSAPPVPHETDLPGMARRRIGELEKELRQTKQRLQAVSAEMDTGQEELQASNEELVASNEELQSTNEELHSVNGELCTVNAEYQKKISELTELTDDMDNLLVCTDIATIFLDRELRIRKFTTKVAEWFQLLPRDVGRPIDAFSHNLLHANLLDDVKRVRENEQPIEREVQDQQGRWLHLRVLPFRRGDAMDGVVLTLSDVSGLKQTKARLERLSAIVESSDDAIVGQSFDRRIENWNHGAEKLFGYRAQDVVGKNIEVILPDVHPSDVQPFFDRIRRGDAVAPIRTQRSRKDGKLLDVSVRLSPVRNIDGQIVGLSAIYRDISDIVRAEAKAKEALYRRDQFLAMLSHELRNPLSAVLNGVELLGRMEAFDADEAEDVLRLVRRQSQHMARLLDDLLDISRMTQNKIQVKKEPIDLKAALRDAVAALRPRFEQKQCRLVERIDESSMMVLGDASRLQQLHTNLLHNAVKYSYDGGNVWLSVSKDDGQIVVSIRDEGVGIPADKAQEVFDPFVQLNNGSDRSDGGLGVGLSLVKFLAKAHGGGVHVSSDGQGKGSEFIVRLPAAEVEPQPDSTEAPEVHAAGRRVVIVEDQAVNRQLLKTVLELHGCEVHDAADGPAGVEAIERTHPDVALIDIGLPKLDGYGVARKLRSNAANDDIWLVALSGYGRDSDIRRSQEAGFDEHLVKPCQPRDLQEILDRPKRNTE